MSKILKLHPVDVKQNIFSPYGRILEPFTDEKPEVSEAGLFNFFVTFRESSQGWQIGYLINEGRAINQLECHPNTAEVFAPLSGNAALVVSVNPEDKKSIISFILNRAIVLNRGVWHGVVSITGKADIMIVESPDVIDKFYPLSYSLTVD